jgi:pimeloyl-ACP methyl ester carboxylesterase
MRRRRSACGLRVLECPQPAPQNIVVPRLQKKQVVYGLRNARAECFAKGKNMETRRFLLAGSVVVAATLGTSSIAGQSANAQTSIAPAPGTYADIPGARIHYTDSGGSGTVVVFMHAATGSTLAWEYQRPAFIAAGYRFIAYDRLGFGRSELNPPGFQPGAAVDDLEALMKYLRIERFHLIGTAAGGIVSLDYALSFPQRLRSLVVANSIGGVQDEEYAAIGRRLRPSPQFNAMPPAFRELGPSYRAENPQGTARWIELEELSRAKSPLPAPQRMRNRITWLLLETITVPTLLLTGDADLYTPPPVLGLFSNRIKTSAAVILREAGHSAYWEQPEMFNRAVLDFVRKH